MRKFLLFAAAAILFDVMPIQAQGQAEVFMSHQKCWFRTTVEVTKSATTDETFNVKGLQLVQALIAQNFRQNPTGIVAIENGNSKLGNDAGSWYSLDGRKLSGRPTQKGIYINSGRKIYIK